MAPSAHLPGPQALRSSVFLDDAGEGVERTRVPGARSCNRARKSGAPRRVIEVERRPPRHLLRRLGEVGDEDALPAVGAAAKLEDERSRRRGVVGLVVRLLPGDAQHRREVGEVGVVADQEDRPCALRHLRQPGAAVLQDRGDLPQELRALAPGDVRRAIHHLEKESVEAAELEHPGFVDLPGPTSLLSRRHIRAGRSPRRSRRFERPFEENPRSLRSWLFPPGAPEVRETARIGFAEAPAQLRPATAEDPVQEIERVAVGPGHGIEAAAGAAQDRSLGLQAVEGADLRLDRVKERIDVAGEEMNADPRAPGGESLEDPAAVPVRDPRPPGRRRPRRGQTRKGTAFSRREGRGSRPSAPPVLSRRGQVPRFRTRQSAERSGQSCPTTGRDPRASGAERGRRGADATIRTSSPRSAAAAGAGWKSNCPAPNRAAAAARRAGMAFSLRRRETGGYGFGRFRGRS